MPLAALAGTRISPLVPSARARAAAGAILVAGGLAGLGWLPKATVLLTLPPQILVGVGLALVLSALTESALEGRSPQAIHGGWTISARHAGVVVGLLALTPVFTADLAEQRRNAIDAGTAVVLDAPDRPGAEDRPGAADRRSARPRARQGSGDRPRLRAAARPIPATAPTSWRLKSDLQDQLDRAATHAFSASFLIAALLGLAALVPIGLSRRVEL